jgi:hypothetical protein
MRVSMIRNRLLRRCGRAPRVASLIPSSPNLLGPPQHWVFKALLLGTQRMRSSTVPQIWNASHEQSSSDPEKLCEVSQGSSVSERPIIGRRLALDLLLRRSGGTSLLDERYLLFVGRAVDVPQVLSAMLGSIFHKIGLWSRRGRG